MKQAFPRHGAEIAIIGMAARFPGADDINQFWQNLLIGREGITHFTIEELREAGVSDELLAKDDYVKAKGFVNDINNFDANFFSFSDREAMLMDPQLRLYFQTAWHALENAGYAMGTNDDILVGIFGGSGPNPLWQSQFTLAEQNNMAANYEAINYNSKDFFNTQVAYRLNLKGPAITVQTACSTSLVAVHLAIQSLLCGDSDMALAGAVALSTDPFLSEPGKQGYVYQEGMISSKDGHCRPFDEQADGTVSGDGVGFVLLKRLDEAIADKDFIYAVIKGSAINNDGHDKVGFTAPSVAGQAQVIQTAIDTAEVEADTIGYIEAHGTGTNLGDPIEIKALDSVFNNNRSSICYIGSVKSNFGHLDTVAGMAGLIKAVLCLQHQQIPPNLYYSTPNPKINFQTSKLKVCHSLIPWNSDQVLRCGISSFGIGGTNAHIILEEYPREINKQLTMNNDIYLLPVSAKTKFSLSKTVNKIHDYVENDSSQNYLDDVSYTLQEHREHFVYRHAWVYTRDNKFSYSINGHVNKNSSPIIFMFTGQGSQYPLMAKDLYESEVVFHNSVNQCLELLQPILGEDLRKYFIDCDDENLPVNETRITQPVLFIIEYALVKLFFSWGIEPTACIGHSLGEITAACIAGIMDLPEALLMITYRSRLMDQCDSGRMLYVACSEAELLGEINETLSLAAVNGEKSCVISGSNNDIENYSKKLKTNGVTHQLLNTSHGFHSYLVEPVLNDLLEFGKRLSLKHNQIPLVSNVTGTWLKTDEAVDAEYWVKHLRQTVRFYDGLNVLLESYPRAVFLELGPGNTLTGLLKTHPLKKSEHYLINSLRSKHETCSDREYLMKTAAHCYIAGVSIEWLAIRQQEEHNYSKIPVPAYVFDTRTYIPELKKKTPVINEIVTGPGQVGFYKPHWVQDMIKTDDSAFQHTSDQSCLVFHDKQVRTAQLVDKITALQTRVTIVNKATSYNHTGENTYQLNEQKQEEYLQLLEELQKNETLPDILVYCWSQEQDSYQDVQIFDGLFYLIKAFAQIGFTKPLTMIVCTEECYAVAGSESVHPKSSLVYGPVKVISQEYPHITTCQVDMNRSMLTHQWVNNVLHEIFNNARDVVVAYRGAYRWLREYHYLGSQLALDKNKEGFQKNGVYLITGGLGGLGHAVGKYLSTNYQAKIVLLARQLHNHSLLLNQIKAAGGDVMIVQADITNEEELEQAFIKTIKTFGSINGVIHCAGLAGDGMIQRKTIEQAHDVLNVKVVGSNNVLSLSKRNAVDFVVLFSSVTGILGGLGQVDYTAANAYLDAQSELSDLIGEQNVYSINWDTWRETGMAVNHSSDKTDSIDLIHPLLGGVVEEKNLQRIFHQHFIASKLWVMNEHMVLNIPTLPGTALLEMAGSAFRQQTQQSFSLSDIYFKSALALADDEEANVYTCLENKGDKFYFEIGSYRSQNQNWTVHVMGQLADIGEQVKTAPSLDVIKNCCQKKHIAGITDALQLGRIAMNLDMQTTDQEAYMKYGTRWNNTKEIWLGEEEGLALLELNADCKGDMENYYCHPALLDCAVSFLRGFLAEGVYLPMHYNEIQVFQSLPLKFYSHAILIKDNSQSSGTMSFQITLFNPGECYIHIKELTFKKIDESFAEKNSQQISETQSIPLYVEKHQSQSLGLGTHDAIEALQQIVQSNLHSIVVSASDFKQRFRDSNTLTLAEASQFKTPTVIRARPELDIAYVTPRTTEQKKLAKLWSNMLGIEKVGIHDNFFELGGDSLVLMQIHSQLKELLRRDVAITELYDHSSIAKLTTHLFQQSNDKKRDGLNNISKRIQKQKQAVRRKRQRSYTEG